MRRAGSSKRCTSSRNKKRGLLLLNFDEYLEFIGKEHLRQSLVGVNTLFDSTWSYPSPDLAHVILPEILREYDDYLVYGGYPGIALTVETEKKQRRLGAIFNDYIRKDLGTLFSVDYLNQFTRLVRILASQTGGLLTYANLASTLGLNQRTVGRYLDILETTFILTRVFPHRINIKKRLVKSPKIYFFDNGIRNMALGDFSAAVNRADMGSLVENSIFHFLKGMAQDPDPLNPGFWRTSSGAEVDFVQGDLLVEVKAGEITGNAPRALYSCMLDTGIKKALVLNRSRLDYKIDEIGEVVFFPYCLLK